MILKRKEFVIQWKKFGLKRSCIFKVMNLWSLCLYLIFYLIFKWIFKCFSLFKSRKRGWTYRRWWRGERAQAASWRGARVSAWMRLGTEATWQSHGWPTGGAGGADAWQEATQTGPRGRPCGATSHRFLRVGLCPTRLTFCRRRERTVGVGFHQDSGDRVDPSPRDHQSSTCANVGLSELDRGILLRHVASSDGRDLHRDSHRSDGWRWIILMIADRVNLDRPLTWSPIGWRGEVVEDLHDRGSIEPRSRRDQTAIAARSSRDCGSSDVEAKSQSRRTF